MQRSLCHDCCKMNRSNITCESAGNFNSSFKRIQTPFLRLSLAPSNFFSFPKKKINLKGRRFDTVEEIKEEMRTVLNTLTKEQFQDAFQELQKCCDQLVRSRGGTTLKMMGQNKVQGRRNKLTLWPLVRKRTILTERPLLVDEI
jgi:arsenate reductase-like glutaredoxin family protein